MDDTSVTEMSDEVDFTPSVISDESLSTQTSFHDDYEAPVISVENPISQLPISVLPASTHTSSSPLLDYSIPLQPSYWPSYPSDAYLPHQPPVYNFTEYGNRSPEVEYSLHESYPSHSIPFTVSPEIHTTTEDITLSLIHI